MTDIPELVSAIRQQNWKNGGALVMDTDEAEALVEQALSAATKRAEDAERLRARDDKAMTVAYDAMNAERKAAEQRAATAEARVKEVAFEFGLELVDGVWSGGPIDAIRDTKRALQEALAREAEWRAIGERVVEKVESGRMRSVETYSQCKELLSCSVTPPHPWGEVVQAAHEVGRLYNDGQVKDDAGLWEAVVCLCKAVSALPTSAQTLDTAVLIKAARLIDACYWQRGFAINDDFRGQSDAQDALIALSKALGSWDDTRLATSVKLPSDELIEVGRLAVAREKAKSHWEDVMVSTCTDDIERAADERLEEADDGLSKACAAIIEKEKGDG